MNVAQVFNARINGSQNMWTEHPLRCDRCDKHVHYLIGLEYPRLPDKHVCQSCYDELYELFVTARKAEA